MFSDRLVEVLECFLPLLLAAVGIANSSKSPEQGWKGVMEGREGGREGEENGGGRRREGGRGEWRRKEEGGRERRMEEEGGGREDEEVKLLLAEAERDLLGDDFIIGPSLPPQLHCLLTLLHTQLPLLLLKVHRCTHTHTHKSTICTSRIQWLLAKLTKSFI